MRPSILNCLLAFFKHIAVSLRQISQEFPEPILSHPCVRGSFKEVTQKVSRGSDVGFNQVFSIPICNVDCSIVSGKDTCSTALFISVWIRRKTRDRLSSLIRGATTSIVCGGCCLVD